MRALTHALAAFGLLAAPLAQAQDQDPVQAAQLCQNSLDEDAQPNFNNLDLSNGTISLVGNEEPKKLQLYTNLEPLNTEAIRFPFDQHVKISYVYESAGASHALGYMYLKDIKRAGYADAQGNLLDSNGNGVYDLHEDLYNIGPRTGTGSRTYVGQAPRCNTVRTFSLGGFNFTEPELAQNLNCDATFNSSVSLADARPGHVNTLFRSARVGLQTTGNVSNHNAFSDGGLFPHLPNLLEPAAPANGNRGLGKMVFLLADDDSGRETFHNLAPVTDLGDFGEGVPDYDVSRYDPEGRQRGVNPNPGITPVDRTVDLGVIRGGKDEDGNPEEIVFFLVVYYFSDHRPNDLESVFPCLKANPADGQCQLHLRTSINVFFSKSAWNMDQNPRADAVVAERNIGCGYDEGCDQEDIEDQEEPACRVGTTNQWACGWLDDDTLTRLADGDLFGNLVMPMERVTVQRPVVGNRYPMPHVIMGAPTTDPFRWILGFEDIPGGGDRDFNDVVFVINKTNGGSARSATVSGDISLEIPEEAQDFVITKVRFKRMDDSVRECGNGTPPCWTEQSPGACQAVNGQPPSITYSLAVDCRSWNATDERWDENPRPTWIPVDFSNTEAPHDEVELDLMGMGYTGSQLCWKVDIISPNEFCRPVIDNIDIGYQAVRSGTYSRSSPSTVANAIAWGVYETPGRAWGTDWPGEGMPAATTRAYDGSKDNSLRGRLYFRSLYDPEIPTVTRTVQRWDAGRVMAEAFRSASTDPMARNLYTMDENGNRTPVKNEAESADATSLLFPDGLCDTLHERPGSRYLWDVNRDGRCGTPSNAVADRRITDDTNDRNFFLEWLYGWEHKRNGVKRPWPLGGVNMSTVALAIPPSLDTWAFNALPPERDLYRENFVNVLKNRSTVAFVGTMNGFLHAFKSGEFRNETDDLCADGYQQRGLFKTQGTTCGDPITPRQYGDGVEKFVYLPRLLLPYYRNLYVQVPLTPDEPPAEKPMMDAPATIANVDFGGVPGKPAWTPSPTAAKETGAKTVLVSSSGNGGRAVFALDITNPQDTWYPLPLWEFDVKSSAIVSAFSAAQEDDGDIVLPDNSSSRHQPSVGRLAWGTNSTQPGEWAAVVGTDFVPSNVSTQAGTLYVLSMKKGTPLSFGNPDGPGKWAGVITLDKGFGVAGPTALVDMNRDGNYEVMYVPTTAGNVYRINLDQIDVTAPLGQQVKRCRVASAPVALTENPQAAEVTEYQDPIHQRIHSNLAVKVIRDATTPSVQFFFGTSDNPDLIGDGPEDADGNPDKRNYVYHLLAFEDTDPLGRNDCEMLDPMWVQKLHPGQVTWGGVMLSADKVYATTAVGASADICNLSRDSGRFYESGQTPVGTNPPPMQSELLGGHGIAAPVVHDQHLFVPTATGKVQVKGDNTWNTGVANVGATRTRVLIYDPIPDGRMPK